MSIKIEGSLPIPEPQNTKSLNILDELARSVLGKVPELAVPGTILLGTPAPKEDFVVSELPLTQQGEKTQAPVQIIDSKSSSSDDSE